MPFFEVLFLFILYYTVKSLYKTVIDSIYCIIVPHPDIKMKHPEKSFPDIVLSYCHNAIPGHCNCTF